MNRFLQNVDATLRNRCLLPADAPILVAVSGGLDSMVLMRVLLQLAQKKARSVAIAHFNHRLRARHSDADELFVRRSAEKLGVPIFIGAGDVSSYARENGLSIEMAARTLRHQYLARTARAAGISSIALAHHADDQVELFFLRLLRGAAPEGLAGMKWKSPSPVDAGIDLIRPLLGHSRSDLAGYARAQKIRFRTDASNESLDHLRNRVRHQLLPRLKRDYQPAIERVILRAMTLLGAESDFVEEAAQQAMSNPGVTFDNLPPAVQRRMLRDRVLACGAEPRFEWIEALRTSANTPLSVRPNLRLIREADGPVRALAGGLQKETFTSSLETNIVLRGQSGRIEHGEHVIRWKIRRGATPAIRRRAGGEWFDADAVGQAICLRHWRAGDRYQPLGTARPSKLQNLLTNAKIARPERHRLLVATGAAGEIWWVERLRIGERFKVRPESRRFLQWNWSLK